MSTPGRGGLIRPGNAPAAGRVAIGVQPGVYQPAAAAAASSVVAATPWVRPALLNAWAASGGGVNGCFYRMLSIGVGMLEIILDLTNPTNTGNVQIFTLPTGFIPFIPSGTIVGINDPTFTHPPPWITVANTGAVTCDAYPAVNQNIFGNVFCPMDVAL